jgi:hypothetical protein
LVAGFNFTSCRRTALITTRSNESGRICMRTIVDPENWTTS